MVVVGVKNERGEDGVLATPRDLLEMMAKREHDIYVPVHALVGLLHISDRITASLRHLVECHGECRKELGGVPAELFANYLAQCYGGVFDGDSGKEPNDLRREIDAGEGTFYTLCTTKEMSTLLLRGGALHMLIEDISRANGDASPVNTAISAGRMMERFGNHVYTLVERSITKGDPFTYIVSCYSSALREISGKEGVRPSADIPGVPGNGDTERAIKEVLEGFFGVKLPGPGDPEVN